MTIKNILMAGVATLGVASCGGNASEGCVEGDCNKNAALECIMTRSSVRAYTDQPVDSADVEKMLRAAMAAPSAMNKQPWRFVVINDRGVLDTIASKLHNAGMAAHAPLAILVCGDMADTIEGEGRDYWIEDTSASSENLLLAAHALGLGGVWCGIYPLSERVADVRAICSLPESVVPMGLMVIGHPAKEGQPKDKWDPSKIHYNRW